MNKPVFLILAGILVMTLHACGIYSFTGASIPPGTKTFQVNYFENQAGNRPGSIVEPGLADDWLGKRLLGLQKCFSNMLSLTCAVVDLKGRGLGRGSREAGQAPHCTALAVDR